MADIIKLLPDSVANQIAAGEVVQRPSSVVKELVENALDAGATQIDVLIMDAGRTSIQIIDDGKGMSETDARMSFERHATSKIRKAEDLFNLHTMGFRGEALASIAAVSQVELKTRRADDELGTQIVISGGMLEHQEPTNCAEGSNFCVRNLFFNIPARRKFLKSNQVEMNNILQEFERIVLVHPEVGFSLYSNESEMYRLPVSTFRQRITALFGKKINQQLLPVEVETSLVKIKGYVGLPEAAKKKGAHQFFFVNGRYMRHPYFHKAVTEAYERLVPQGEQVPYFLEFEVEPENIDVNIHPTKTEIKFENEQAIWQIIAAAVKESLGKFNAAPSIDFDQEGNVDIVPLMGSDAVSVPTVDFDPNYNPFDAMSRPASAPSFGSSPSNRKSVPDWEPLYNGFEKGETVDLNFDEPQMDAQLFSQEEQTFRSAMNEEDEPDTVASVQKETKSEAASADYLQIQGQYIITPTSGGIMIIDQHRASARIIFDHLMNQFETRKSATQKLIFPEMLRVSASEAVVLESIIDDIEILGFEINNLGGGSFSIAGIPADMEGLDAAGMIQELIHTALEKSKDVKEEVREQLAVKLANRAAIPVGQFLTPYEMHELVSTLFVSTMPNLTPDGKRVLVIKKCSEIEKMF
ncbi:MAG: DNA mismatch repair endonuclease MutL [Bacteroidaceae bacterium]|nr:DNA mismatch repair endonuclease MutL [Bacteroidaceae bacterium]